MPRPIARVTGDQSLDFLRSGYLFASRVRQRAGVSPSRRPRSDYG